MVVSSWLVAGGCSTMKMCASGCSALKRCPKRHVQRGGDDSAMAGDVLAKWRLPPLHFPPKCGSKHGSLQWWLTIVLGSGR
ncbi:hypothetical protein V6N12_065829 [Hibiscus sabdariffa]|uniref:Secreted protein n=1 Tax=Hibiscus sabdariffa TaxID=183260 RepID=A0ABR2GAN9_9ROSI